MDVLAHRALATRPVEHALGRQRDRPHRARRRMDAIVRVDAVSDPSEHPLRAVRSRRKLGFRQLLTDLRRLLESRYAPHWLRGRDASRAQRHLLVRARECSRFRGAVGALVVPAPGRGDRGGSGDRVAGRSQPDHLSAGEPRDLRPVREMRESWPVLDPRASRRSFAASSPRACASIHAPAIACRSLDPNVERAANHASAPLVSWGRAYRSDRTPGASRLEGVALALALTV
jgi:hypothetical protein